MINRGTSVLHSYSYAYILNFESEASRFSVLPCFAPLKLEFEHRMSRRIEFTDCHMNFRPHKSVIYNRCQIRVGPLRIVIA